MKGAEEGSKDTDLADEQKQLYLTQKLSKWGNTCERMKSCTLGSWEPGKDLKWLITQK